ncbi:hypothetical protein FJY63_07275 [Candidatus Sumerlaeota bacterium]|nr:hypothetical protein [Candidatus Sumerlaeota bacterium]
MAARQARKDRLARTTRIGQLLEVYGPLLTERQREFVRLHYDEDMSFGEIAREHSVSRQAVHDAVTQAEAAMERLEASLGLLGRATKGGRAAPPAESTRPSARAEMTTVPEAAEKLGQLRHKLASRGVIYDTTEYIRLLDEALDLLNK